MKSPFSTKPLLSMTGYGRAQGSFKDSSWVWDVRAVNGKSLDVRVKLPPGFESLDPIVRKTTKSVIGRGNLQITLALQSGEGSESYIVNKTWLKEVVKTAISVHQDIPEIAPARIDGLLTVQGVIAAQTPNAADPRFQNRNALVEETLGEMLAHLNAARKTEGKALAKILADVIKSLEGFLKQARGCAAASAAAIHGSYTQKITDMLGDKMPEDKLIQEAAVLALKVDIREELDRLDAHIVQAKALLKMGSPIGRKLDFLSQEFIREINTLCSKSADITLTQVGLEMKSLVEQFREQAANVE